MFYVAQDALETTILKQKQGRDKSIGEMRQKFKNIKILNSFEERELKLRRQKTIFHFDDPKAAEAQKVSTYILQYQNSHY